MSYKIYCLICPQTNNIRYIGKTKMSLKTRLSAHISSSKGIDRNSKTYKANWIKSLLNKGYKPIIKEICTCSEYNVDFLEIEFIKYFKKSNKLTNTTIGGDGSTGHIVSKESKNKMSINNKGVPRPNRRKSLTLINLTNNNKISFPSVFEASNYLKCNKGSLVDVLIGRRNSIFEHKAFYN